MRKWMMKMLTKRLKLMIKKKKSNKIPKLRKKKIKKLKHVLLLVQVVGIQVIKWVRL
jgi:hypothetical protein